MTPEETIQRVRAAMATLPGAVAHDAFVSDGHVAVRWSRDGWTGQSLMRFVDGNVVQMWTTARPPEFGAWPDTGDPEGALQAVVRRASMDHAPARKTIERYCEIRGNQARAEELRAMFIDPMVVHDSGRPRVADIDTFIQRVRDEVDERLVFRADQVVCSGDRAIMRWTYLRDSALIQAGLTIYAFRDGVIAERWQTPLPDGLPWL